MAEVTARRGAAQWLKRDFGPTWRYVFNLTATRAHHRAPLPLSPEADRVVADLRRDGVATTTAAALLGDDALLTEVRARADGLLDERAADLSAPRTDVQAETAAGRKPYVVELLGERPTIAPDDPHVRFVLDPATRAVADAYMGMRTKVRELNIWLNLRTDSPPRMSQRWHRDLPEDHRILKVFLYLTDVTSGVGPLWYVRGSHRAGGPRLEAHRDDPYAARIADGAVEGAYPSSRLAEVTGPAGTVIFADTRGIHRGGWARERDRLALMGLFASGSSVRHPTLQARSGTWATPQADLVAFAPTSP